MILLAIDPGPAESAYVVYDVQDRHPSSWAKLPNEHIAYLVDDFGSLEDSEGRLLAVESIASYGMAVGAEVFETCVWIGRFIERWEVARNYNTRAARRVFRRDCKLHLCGNVRAKDANVRQALIDRYGGREKAIGRKATPGPLYGMKGDCWAALAVAITAAETEES